MDWLLNGLAAVILAIVLLIGLLLWIILMGRIKAAINTLICKHQWSPWYVATATLIGPIGRTVHEVQERKCANCGFMQRAEFEKR